MAAPTPHRQRGVAAVELALLLPLLLLLFLGTGAVLRLYYVNMALLNAAHAGAQYAVTANSEDRGAIAAAALRDGRHDLPRMAAPSVRIVRRCADGSPHGGGACPGHAPAPWTYVEVSADYPFASDTFGMLPGFPAVLNLRQTAIFRLN
ncbi:TadE/TadG family type IV pilus assembly protein [Janthinobacterium fluminis]|uniref:TadE/TadG family type IV pilus assembly protein n=1 Tax=Janthinobacterium fluminis TaxID=2987524 RepID=A0ABT5K146_9BURK|nr:TadE/TadG family type IV pilus assembly protein [Janthinobacterium fluminis]MDC8758021.1 TadE/TadG family type IV pilus assembly protein [Janthinobacterium fluminis]